MGKANKKVPALRFPGFDGKWEMTILGEIAKDFSYGLNAASKEYDGENKYIRITDIDEALNIFKPNPLTSPEGNMNDNYLLKEGDIVFARTGASVGKTYLYNKNDGKLYYAGFLIKASIKKVNPHFIFLQTLRSKYKKWITIMSMRSGQPGINAEEYKSFPITYPKFEEEQQKIASFFTEIDKQITLITQKKEKLEQYKKGVMQKIFSRKLRFKDENGNDFPEWEEKKLGEIGEFKNGINKSKEDFGIGHPFINLMDVFGTCFIRKKKFGLVRVKEKELNEYNLLKGDILFIRSSVKAEGVGLTAVVLEDLINTTYSGFLIRFRENKQFLDLNFKKYCFYHNEFRNKLLSKSSTSANTNINQESLSLLNLKVPSLPEQRKIADFLSAIDKKIEITNRQIGRMKMWKQGLLQKMFV